MILRKCNRARSRQQQTATAARFSSFGACSGAPSDCPWLKSAHYSSLGCVVQHRKSAWLMTATGQGLGRVKTKSELVVMPSGRQTFAFCCSPHGHRAQNCGLYRVEARVKSTIAALQHKWPVRLGKRVRIGMSHPFGHRR
jgi:hypothetical protein